MQLFEILFYVPEKTNRIMSNVKQSGGIKAIV